MPRSHSSLEILEARIAPAVLLVAGTDLTIKNMTTKTLATSDAAAAAETGADFALLVKSGDSVVYDVNQNGKVDAADVKLLTATGGSAMAFFTDLNSGAPNGKFELQELTGLALAAKTKATVVGDIRGTVAVALDANGHFLSSGGTLTFSNDSLAGLTVTGHVVGGDVLAGGDITNVTFKNPVGARGSVASVTGDLAAGTAADARMVSFNGGAKTLTTASVDKLFGSISKIKLANGASGLYAGHGLSDASTPLAGGSITDVTISDTTTGDLNIKAGDGGNNTGTGAAAAGGSVSKLNVRTNSTGVVFIFGGTGGQAASGDETARAGGLGGDISNVTLVALRDLQSVRFFGGDGGDVVNSTQGARGGAGGYITKVTATVGHASQGISMHSGDGGDGLNAGTSGGLGGELSNVSLFSAGSDNLVNIGSGSGGTSHGATAVGGAEVNGGYSGFGGDVSKVTVVMTGDSTGNIRLSAGSGGDVVGGPGVARSGGSILKSAVTIQAAASLKVVAGQGGSVAAGGTGGFGGTIDGLTVNTRGTAGTVEIGSGIGGSALSATNTDITQGGSGGNLLNTTVNNTGRLQFLHIIAGGGGTTNDVGNAGSGGDLKKLTVKNLGQAATPGGEVFIFGGAGGAAQEQGDGGFGGAVDKVTYTDPVGMTPELNGSTFSGVVFISGGSGGNAAGEDQKGGFGGDVSNLTLKAPHTVFSVGLPNAHGGDGYLSGGAGGSIRGVSGSVEAISIAAMDGGQGTGPGDGGSGGDVTKINLTVTEIAQSIRAGNGGDTNSTAGSGGLGGSILHVKVVGDIGDFNSPFYVENPGVGMGGLIAGQGGFNSANTPVRAFNGSVEDINATRISAILAGRSSAQNLSADNAVESIKGIKTQVIGADVNGNGRFDYVETDWMQNPSVYDLAGPGSNGDLAIDGLVIVRAGQFLGAKPPILKLIEV